VLGGLQVSFGLNPLTGTGFYWFVLAIVAACSLLSWYVLVSQTGKAIQAIGRNPGRAAAMGYRVPHYRVALTIYASLIASLGGWLYALQTSFVFIDLLGVGQLHQRPRLRPDRRRRHDPRSAARRRQSCAH